MEVAEKQTTSVASADMSQTTTSTSSEVNQESRVERTATGGTMSVSVDGERKDDSSLTLSSTMKKNEQSAGMVAINQQEMKQSTKLSQIEGDQKIERSQDVEQHAHQEHEMEHSVKKKTESTSVKEVSVEATIVLPEPQKAEVVEHTTSDSESSKPKEKAKSPTPSSESEKEPSPPPKKEEPKPKAEIQEVKEIPAEVSVTAEIVLPARKEEVVEEKPKTVVKQKSPEGEEEEEESEEETEEESDEEPPKPAPVSQAKELPAKKETPPSIVPITNTTQNETHKQSIQQPTVQPPVEKEHVFVQQNENKKEVYSTPNSVTTASTNHEVKEERIRHSLKEIINDIDRVIIDQQQQPSFYQLPAEEIVQHQQQKQQELDARFRFEQEQQRQREEMWKAEQERLRQEAAMLQKVKEHEASLRQQNHQAYGQTQPMTTRSYTENVQNTQDYTTTTKQTYALQYEPGGPFEPTFRPVEPQQKYSTSPFKPEDTKVNLELYSDHNKQRDQIDESTNEYTRQNKKTFASSAFYSRGLHPTVEDQVELARKISSSLSDRSNDHSKGQTMYVSRKKRSVKWIHEGNFFNVDHGNEDDGKENIDQEDAPVKDRHAMKLFMNPYGKVRDLKAMEQQFGPNDILNLNSDGMLSPDRCAQLVTALNAPKGKGAELFAKRRKRSEKWIVNNGSETEPATDTADSQTTTPSPFVFDDAKQFQEVQQSDELYKNRLYKNRQQVIEEEHQRQQQMQQQGHQYQPPPPQTESRYQPPAPEPVYHQPIAEPIYEPPPSSAPWESPAYQSSGPAPYKAPVYQRQPSYELPTPAQPYKLPQHQQQPQPSYGSSNSRRDLAYKPSVAQGWNSRAPIIARGNFVPPEIPTECYKPPSFVAPTPTVHQIPKSSPILAPINQSNDFYGNNSSPAAYSPGGSFLSATPRTCPMPPTQVRNVSPQPFNRPGATPTYRDSNEYGSNLSNPNAPYMPVKPCAIPSIASSNTYQQSTANLSNCQNYNRAARGWGSGGGFYKPISFEGQSKPSYQQSYKLPAQTTSMSYSDF